jgi:cell division protein FtsI (penicillin-binding protein 3)
MTRRRAADPASRQQQIRLRRGLLLGSFALGALLVLARAFQLQALEGDRWAQEAIDQQRERVQLPARRGTIFDRDGVPLALTYETFRISVAPRELKDREATVRRLVSALGLSRAQARRVTSSERRWSVIPGRFTVEQRQALGDAPGLYIDRELERFYPQGNVGRELIGVVTRDGRALGGVEQEFDDQLRGEPGYAIMRRDAHGDVQSALSLPVVPPKDGADVYLAIDFDMQEIADAALRSAVDSAGASGGDLVLLDPHTGDVLAAVSRRAGRAQSLSAVTEPYEPGSTLKPFIAAALLEEGKVAPGDQVFAEAGRWVRPERIINDSHPLEWVTLADVIRESSNIGIAKFSSRLTPAEQYQHLRDFGFGTPTGVEFPAESNGRLRRPSEWSKLSSQSLAMGYELSVTPLQIAVAYGALANGGMLMEPHLLREVRLGGTRIIDRTEPRMLRRVVRPAVARKLTDMLVAVVQDGTATRAGLESFEVAGKTGTARRTGASGRYAAGSYTASFAGYFPASAPQIVIFVKIDNPQGEYYGGATAAPVTRETLQGILAARSSALDGKSLLATRLPVATVGTLERRSAPEPRPGDPVREGTYVFQIAEGLPTPAAPQPRRIEVPSLGGLPLRTAARRAHALGLRVRVAGSGRVLRTEPAAGVGATSGDTLLLIGGAD